MLVSSALVWEQTRQSLRFEVAFRLDTGRVETQKSTEYEVD